jgi:thiopeptide-type bacteriocin biosynthesis protein
LPKFIYEEPVVIRSPAFPVDLIRGLLSAGDAETALHEMLQARPDVVATILLASPSLHHAVTKWLKRKANDSRGVASAAMAYVIRCATRSTPFAACATVGTIAVGTTAQLRCEDDIRRRTRPDAGWLYDVVTALEDDPAVFRKLQVQWSGQTYRMSGRLTVADTNRSGYRRAGGRYAIFPIPTAFNDTPALRLVRDLCRSWVRVTTVTATLVRELSCSEDDAAAFLRQLVKIGVLCSNVRIPPVGEPAVALQRVLDDAAPDVGARLRSYRDHLRAADERQIDNVTDVMFNARELAEQIQTSPHYWQVDSVRAYQSQFPEEALVQLGAVLEDLLRIVPRRDHNAMLARQFETRYNTNREVPLLEYLDSASGMRFEEAPQQSSNTWTALEQAVFALAVDSLAAGGESVELTDHVLDGLASKRDDQNSTLPSHVEALCHVMEGDTGEITLALTGAMHGRHRMLARFGDMIGDALPPSYGTNDAGKASTGPIEAEVVALPFRRRAANVTTRSLSTGFEIVCGVAGSQTPDKTLTLDDLVVGVGADGRMYLRSLKLGRVVEVVQNHALNLAGSSRVEHFFDSVSSPDVRSIGFPWLGAAAVLPFRPRILRKGIIVSLATWHVPVSVCADMDSPDSAYWRTLYRVPRFVYLAEADHRLFLDLDCHLSRTYLRRVARRSTQHWLELQEAIPALDQAPLVGMQGRYLAEVAVTFRTNAERQARTAPHVEPPDMLSRELRRIALRPFGSEWLYVRAYVAAEHTLHFLRTAVEPLLATLAEKRVTDRWFFIRYADPEHHVRLRFRARDGMSQALWKEVGAWIVASVESGDFDRITIDTYDREVERYGGAGCIDIAEALFCADSEHVIGLRGSSVQREEKRFQLAELCAFTLALFDGDVASANGWLRRSVPRRMPLPPASWDVIRIVASRGLPSTPSLDRIRACGCDLRTRLPADRADNVLSAVLHMHCNRLGLDRGEEARARAEVLALTERLIRQDATPRQQRPDRG